MEEGWQTCQFYNKDECALPIVPLRVHSVLTRNDTEKVLLEKISLQIQQQKPENVPKPPYTLAGPAPTSGAAAPTPAPAGKGKQSSGKGKAPAAAPQVKQVSGRRLPVPPEPQPPLANCVSPYSPALATGMLIEAVKAGMNATEPNPIGGAGAGAGSGIQKGKRKVVRVRGG